MIRFRSLIAALIAAVLAFTLAACGSDDSLNGSGDDSTGSETVTITHAQGDTEVPVNPQKIVVLDFGVLDSLDALGVDGVVGLPKTAVPEHLSKFAGDDVADIGTMAEPDIEKIAELDPDVILIGGRTAPKYAELAELAPTIDLTVDGTDFLASLEKQVTSIGQIFDKSDEVTSQLDELNAQIDQTKADAEGKGKGLIVMVSGGKLSAFGIGSRFGFVHDSLGIEPAVAELSTDRHGQAISHEFIAEANPEWIFVIDRDAAIGQEGASAQQVLDNELVNGTTAAQNDQIVYLDGARWYVVGAGLNNVVEMIKPISEAMAG